MMPNRPRDLCRERLWRSVATSVLLAILATVPAQTARAQAGNVPGDAMLDPGWQFGFDAFQLMLEQRGLTSSEDFVATLKSDATKSAIVLVGDLNRLPEWTWPQIVTFIRRGGAVMVASDRATDVNGLFVLGQGPVEATSSRYAYTTPRGAYYDCPKITTINDQHPLTRGISELIGNRSGWVDRIAKQQGDWSMLAFLPRSAMTRTGQGSGKPIAASMQLLNGNPGRLLVLGDHSLFINGMLWHGDNAMFALNVTSWLAEGGRDQVLFVVNGATTLPGIDPSTNPGDMPDINPEDLPDIPKESYLAFANGFASALQDSDVLNQLAADYPLEMESGFYWRCVFLALACLAGWILFRRFPSKGQPVDEPIRRTASSLLATRVQEQIQSKNLRLAAREISRDLLRELTGSEDSGKWSIEARDVQISGSTLLRRTTRSVLNRCSRLATNRDRSHVSRKDLRRLVSRIEHVRKLFRAGKLTHPWFAPDAIDGTLASATSTSQVWQAGPRDPDGTRMH